MHGARIKIINNAVFPCLTRLIPYINQPSMHHKCTQLFIIRKLFPCNTLNFHISSHCDKYLRIVPMNENWLFTYRYSPSRVQSIPEHISHYRR